MGIDEAIDTLNEMSVDTSSTYKLEALGTAIDALEKQNTLEDIIAMLEYESDGTDKVDINFCLNLLNQVRV